MNCDETKSLIYTYIDGETRVVRRWRIRRHLEHCPPCEEGAVFETRFKLRVRESCREELPVELEQRLRSFIRQQHEGTEA